MKSIKQLFLEIKKPSSKYDTYFDVYEELFSRFKDKDIVFVEVGILGGGSLEVWRKYFGAKARIIGLDMEGGGLG